MLVTCPSCQSDYRIADASAVDGRKLRCARCKAEWAPDLLPAPIAAIEDAAAIDAIDMAEVFEDEVAPKKGAPLKAQPRKRLFAWRTAKRAVPKPSFSFRARLPRAVAMMAAGGCAALGVLIGERVSVVRAAPSLASLYAAMGLETNVRGLAIRDVRSSEEIDEGVPLLLVTGVVANVSGAPVEAPRLRLAVRSDDGRDIYAWTTVIGRQTLAPGETAPFRARLASPPAEGRSIAVRFLGRQDLTASATR